MFPIRLSLLAFKILNKMFKSIVLNYAMPFTFLWGHMGFKAYMNSQFSSPLDFQTSKLQNRIVPLLQIRWKGKVKTDIVYKKILVCVDEVFKELGPSAAEALYYYLKNNFGLSRSEIPKRPKIFVKALYSIFGEKGAKFIEKICIEKLEQEFNLKIDKEISLINAIEIIKRNKLLDANF